MKPQNVVRVVLVDDHRVVRAGLTAILAEQEVFNVLGEAGTFQEALELVERVQPDLVLMDMRLPDRSGAEACRAIKARWRTIKVVVLSSFADETLVFEAVAAGVDGYLMKDSDDAALVSSLLTVASGKQVLSPVIVQMVMGRGGKVGHSREIDLIKRLTPRDISMVKLISEGCTYKEVAIHLNIAEKTVRNSLSLMLDKLGIESRSQLVAIYARSTSIDRR